MVELVHAGIRGVEMSSLIVALLAYDLNPVALKSSGQQRTHNGSERVHESEIIVYIRVQREGYEVHPPLRQTLLERIASVFEPLTGGLNIVDRNADVTEALLGFDIAAVVGRSADRFSLASSQFQNAFLGFPV